MCHTSSRYKVWTGKVVQTHVVSSWPIHTFPTRHGVDKSDVSLSAFFLRSQKQASSCRHFFAGYYFVQNGAWSKRRIRQIRAFLIICVCCVSVMYNVCVCVCGTLPCIEFSASRFGGNGFFISWIVSAQCVCVCVCLCDCKSRWFIVLVFLGYSFFCSTIKKGWALRSNFVVSHHTQVHMLLWHFGRL